MRPTPEQSCTLWLIASWEDSLADSQRDSGEPVTTFSPTITPALPPLPTVAADSRVPMFWSGTRVALRTTVRPTLGLLVTRVALRLLCRGVQHSCRWLFGLLPRGPTLP